MDGCETYVYGDACVLCHLAHSLHDVVPLALCGRQHFFKNLVLEGRPRSKLSLTILMSESGSPLRAPWMTAAKISFDRTLIGRRSTFTNKLELAPAQKEHKEADAH